jgi:formylglycine-generating enzyme required for sulfatase activity
MSAINDSDQYDFEFETVQVGEQGQIIELKRDRILVFRECLANAIELELVAIPSGEFMMGSPESEYDRSVCEGPQHLVSIQPFFMGKYPVTQAQWYTIADTSSVDRVLDLNLCGFEEDNLPVENLYWDAADNLPITGVYWDEAIEFCQRLSRDTGRNYRLPTEAEWEYACRAGTLTPFNFGPTITPDLANYRGIDCGTTNDKWFFSGSYDRGPKGIYHNDITPVDAFGPNAFGLHDMHGNVSEWCLDQWHGDYRDAPTDGSAWIAGGDDNVVLRGGAFDTFPAYCRSASRQLQTPERYSRHGTIGFRVICEMPKRSDSSFSDGHLPTI